MHGSDRCGSITGVICLATMALWSPAQAAAQEVDDATRLKNCQAQTVTILQGWEREFRVPGHDSLEKADEPVIAAMLGKTASIVAVTGPASDLRLIVKPDGSEQTFEVRRPWGALGFQGELEKARAFIGRRLWTTGLQEFMASPGDLERYWVGGGERLSVKPATLVTIRDVQWGTSYAPFIFRIEIGDGRTAYLPIDHMKPFDLSCRFFLLPSVAPTLTLWAPEDDGFLAQDPHTTYAKWGATAWKLIDSGEVAVGMTQEMLTVVCGQGLRRIGAILTEGPLEEVWECPRVGRFVVREGKVVRLE